MQLDPGGVDEPVRRAERLGHRVDGGSHGVVVGDVAAVVGDAGALSELVRQRAEIDGGDSERRVGLEQGAHGREPDPAGGAGHDRDAGHRSSR